MNVAVSRMLGEARGRVRPRRIRTADSGFLVLLEVVVDKAEYEGGLEVEVRQCQMMPLPRCEQQDGRRRYLSYSSLAE